MSQLRRLLPASQLALGSGGVSGNYFDRGFLWRACTAFSKKHRAAIRAPQIAQQGEPAVNDLAFPPFPCLAHGFASAAHATDRLLYARALPQSNASPSIVPF